MKIINNLGIDPIPIQTIINGATQAHWLLFATVLTNTHAIDLHIALITLAIEATNFIHTLRVVLTATIINGALIKVCVNRNIQLTGNT